VRPVGQPDVLGHPVPVPNLPAGVRVRLRLTCASRQRLAIEVVELRRELADDSPLTFGRQPGQRQPRTHEGFPVPHVSRP
jgi:hypothetical protein